MDLTMPTERHAAAEAVRAQFTSYGRVIEPGNTDMRINARLVWDLLAAYDAMIPPSQANPSVPSALPEALPEVAQQESRTTDLLPNDIVTEPPVYRTPTRYEIPLAFPLLDIPPDVALKFASAWVAYHSGTIPFTEFEAVTFELRRYANPVALAA